MNFSLSQRIANLEKELAELKSKLNHNTVWKPKEGEMYWIINNDGKLECCNHYSYYGYINFGNYFKTKKEAEKQTIYNKVINKFRKYVNTHSAPLDWEDEFQDKYYLYYVDAINMLDIGSAYLQRDSFQIYASSKQILKDAIIYSAGSEKEFIRIVFGVENG